MAGFKQLKAPRKIVTHGQKKKLRETPPRETPRQRMARVAGTNQKQTSGDAE